MRLAALLVEEVLLADRRTLKCLLLRSCRRCRRGTRCVARYVEFVAGRCRPNTVIATMSDLRIVLRDVDKHPFDVTPADVFEFIAAQRRGPDDGRVVSVVRR